MDHHCEFAAPSCLRNSGIVCLMCEVFQGVCALEICTLLFEKFILLLITQVLSSMHVSDVKTSAFFTFGLPLCVYALHMRVTSVIPLFHLAF